MTCTAIPAADWEYFTLMVASLPFFTAVAGYFIARGVCEIASFTRDRLREHRAAVPFAERARRLEERRERAVALWSRIAQRNRREALRFGQGVE
jgi:hypothetical protein